MKSIEEAVRIVLVDDHPLLRLALRNILEQQNDFKIIGEAGDGEEAEELINRLVPDVVIMDIGIPKINGIEVTRHIKEAHPEIVILALTIHTDFEHIFGILEAGAAGYLTKSVFSDEVTRAIHTLLAGDNVLSPEVLQKVIQYASQYRPKTVHQGSGEKLTGREVEVLKLASKGISNKEIADRMGLGLRTVKNYLSNIFMKLQVASRTEAVMAALDQGVITKQDTK